MSINCIIVDDEPAARDILKTYVADSGVLQLVKACKNAYEAQEALKNETIDLMFLDINMPKISGLTFIKSLVAPPPVIFTTAYPNYALEGFEVSAVDYLLKPFSFERFLKAINKATSLIDKSTDYDQQTIVLKSDKKLFRVPTSDIIYIEAVGDYVKVVFGEQSILVHSTLNDVLAQITNLSIVRTHRSFAINLNKFDHIDGNQIYINNKTVPIGKTYRKDLLERLKL